VSDTGADGAEAQLRLASPADADSRSRQQRGQRRRQQIIDAAVELFATRGYRGTDIAEVAERVGITATGLMYYFGTKERLLHEAVAAKDRADAIDNYDDISLADFRNVGRHDVQNALLTRLFVRLGIESSDPDHPLHDYFIERYEQVRGFYQEVLERDRDLGKIGADVDLRQVATELLSTLLGAQIQWVADPDRIDLAAVMDAYVEQLTRDLAPPRPGRAR